MKRIGGTRQPHPRNAPGPFYVVQGGCLSDLGADDECEWCRAPDPNAPDLVAHDGGPGPPGHCYFSRQPLTWDECERAVLACLASSCDRRYAGDDPAVLALFLGDGGSTAAGARHCDALAGLSPSQIRGRVEAGLRRRAAHGDPMWDHELDL